LYGRVRLDCPALLAEGFGPGEPRFEDLVLRYDAEIAHTDHSLRLLFQGLEELGVLNRTLVVITADHGEEFLEHSFVEHGWTLYNESLHVPLIFWAPAVLEPQRHSALVSTVDLLPTLLELMDIPRHGREFDGSALFHCRGGRPVFVPPTGPFVAELLIQHRSLLRTVIDGDWKYIAAQSWLGPESRAESARDQLRLIQMYWEQSDKRRDIWGPVLHEELFNLADDSTERRNLAGDSPERLFRLRAALQDLEARSRQRGVMGRRAEEEPRPLSPEEIEQLRSLGYL
jgi:arylsulfatase A-like enzyme